MTSRNARLIAAASAALLSLTLSAPVLAAHDPRPGGPIDGSFQQATGTPTSTGTPNRGPDGRGPDHAPGRPTGTATGSATPGATGRDRAKTPPTLPPNASDRARTVVAAVFERNQQIRDLITQMRAARGLPNSGADEDVTDEFAKNAKQKRSGDAVVDAKALTPEQREQFQTQLKAIMAAFAETLRQSASATDAASAGASVTPTPTASATSTATATTTATPRP